MGDGNTRGYQYGRNHSTGGTQESGGFSLGGFVRDTLTGAVIGGLGSAGFYGAGRAVEVLRGSVGRSRGGRDTELFLPDEYYQKMDDNIARAIIARDAEVTRIQGLSMSQQRKVTTVVGGVDVRTGEVMVGIKDSSSYGRLAVCAEDIVYRGLGGNQNANIIMTSAIRPRTGQVIPVCVRCQTKYTYSQFIGGTMFQ